MVEGELAIISSIRTAEALLAEAHHVSAVARSSGRGGRFARQDVAAEPFGQRHHHRMAPSHGAARRSSESRVACETRARENRGLALARRGGGDAGGG